MGKHSPDESSQQNVIWKPLEEVGYLHDVETKNYKAQKCFF
jgi:hypothetical protein